jgi:hypothetical protein
VVDTGWSDCQLNASNVRGRCWNPPYLNVLIDRTRIATRIMSAVSWKWPIISTGLAEIMHSELEQSTVRSVVIQRKVHLPCKQTTAGRALIHLTLRAHPWPTHIFTCVSGLYLSNDFLSRGNDNYLVSHCWQEHFLHTETGLLRNWYNLVKFRKITVGLNSVTVAPCVFKQRCARLFFVILTDLSTGSLTSFSAKS